MEVVTRSHKDNDDSNAEGSEEGEILDSMDSEEEHNMRQRIYELEAKNAELEKIARISSDYTNQYRYLKTVPECHQISQKNAARIPSDASPISSDEFEPIKKHVKKKKRTLCPEFCTHPPKIKCAHKRRHRSNDTDNNRCKARRTLKGCHRKQNKTSLNETLSYEVPNGYFETISLDSDEDIKEEKISSSSDEDDNPLHLNRAELRFALARDTTGDTRKSKNLLKDRLCNSSFVEIRKNDDEVANSDPASENQPEMEGNIYHSRKDEAISQEEQELRLIALKSAVLKKHLARKKRNAEIAYSPTDFEPVSAQPKCQSTADVIDVELDELEDVMEISPLDSPKLIPSPSNEEEYKLGAFYNYEGDNNSVDMDIADSGSDDEKPNGENSVKSMETPWSPIVLAPLTAQGSQTYSPIEHPLPIQYGIYLPEMQYFPNTIDDEEPPPPPPFNLNLIPHNDSTTRTSIFERLGEKTEENYSKSIQTLFPDNVESENFHLSNSDKESDEEASALRAVLLSRFNQKNRRKDTNGMHTHTEKTANSENVSHNDTIESVLQKALKRLKSTYDSSYTKTKETPTYQSNEIEENFLNTTTFNSHPSADEECTKTPFDSNENSNSGTFIDVFQNSKSPCFAENYRHDSNQGVDLEASQSTEAPVDNIPGDELTNESDPLQNLLLTDKATEARTLKTLSSTQAETSKVLKDQFEADSHSTENSPIHNLNKDKQPDLKNQPKPTTRAQPLSVKNTLNQSTLTIAKSTQPPTLLKKVRRTTKIVRRNKVINREVTTSIKRPSSKTSSSPIMQPKTANDNTAKTNAQNSAASENVPPKITVKKLIINLRKSETETSDDELLSNEHHSKFQNVEQNSSLLNANINSRDLVVNSELNSSDYPSETPTFKNSQKEQKLPSSNSAFEMKLDSFLKNIRAKETQQSKKHSPIKHPLEENSKTSAVRHLPLSSQDEYRRLVHRMKSLEKQKKSRISDADERPSTTAHNSKKEITKEEELKILNSYEKSFDQTSENIVALLNQSLGLVEEAKRAKIAKLRHERRLRELRAEMDALTAEVRQEELKLNSMKPHLGKSNQFLLTLKKKNRDLLHSANKLGKSIKGDTYSLVNKAGDEISSKSKRLQSEIKLVNALKPDNIEQFLSLQDKERETSLAEDVQATCISSAENVAAIDDCLDALVPRLPENASRANKPFRSNESDEQQVLPVPSTEINSHGDKEAAEPQVNLQLDANKEANVKFGENKKAFKSLRSYVSPLEHLKNTFGYLDFNAIVCPYEMWGKCADDCCNYLHMTAGREKGTELVKPFKNFL